MNESKKLSESGVLLALFAVMLFVISYIPVLGSIFMFLLPIPFVLISIKYNVKWSFLFFGAACILTVIIGTFVMLPFPLILGLIGITMGYHVRTNKSRLQMFIISVLIFISGMLMLFVSTVLLLDMNIIDKVTNIIEQSVERTGKTLSSMGQEDQSEQLLETILPLFDFFQTLLPSIIVLSSIIMVAIVFLACKPLINRFSDKKLTIAPIRDMQLPRSLLWYYLFIMIGSLIINPQVGQTSYTIIVNLLFTLQFFILLQGISLIFFYSHAKGWSKAIPIIVVVFSTLLALTPFIRILGIMDIGFRIREKLVHK